MKIRTTAGEIWRWLRRNRRAEAEQRVREQMSNGRSWHVVPLSGAAKISPAQLHVLLVRWENAGLVKSGWHEPVPPNPYRRRWYRAVGPW